MSRYPKSPIEKPFETCDSQDEYSSGIKQKTETRPSNVHYFDYHALLNTDAACKSRALVRVYDRYVKSFENSSSLNWTFANAQNSFWKRWTARYKWEELPERIIVFAELLQWMDNDRSFPTRVIIGSMERACMFNKTDG